MEGIQSYNVFVQAEKLAYQNGRIDMFNEILYLLETYPKSAPQMPTGIAAELDRIVEESGK